MRRQHFLYFLPLPQGHGAFRETFGRGLRGSGGGSSRTNSSYASTIGRDDGERTALTGRENLSIVREAAEIDWGERIRDEIAFWRSEDSANPDREIVNAIRPAMATVPNALLLAISSPYARRGVLWDAYRLHYGREDNGILVWQAPTRAMNPSVDERVVAEAYAQDESAAAAEYGAEFRKDIESFVAREAIAAVVVNGRRELKPTSGAYTEHSSIRPGAVRMR